MLLAVLSVFWQAQHLSATPLRMVGVSIFSPHCDNMYAFYPSVIWATSFKSSETKTHIFACQMLSVFEARNNAKSFLFLFLINLTDQSLSEVLSLSLARLFCSSHISTYCPLLCLPLARTCIFQSSEIVCDSTWINIGEWSSSHWGHHKCFIWWKLGQVLWNMYDNCWMIFIIFKVTSTDIALLWKR